MLKSCKYCGRIHDSKHDCGRRPAYRKKNPAIERFRSSPAWRHKRESIRARDKGLCQICIREMYDTVDRYTFDDLSVHHAVPLSEDFGRSLDDGNLITLCSRHHEMAETGAIPRAEIQRVIDEQEASWMV